jgi:hypothetical protein
MKRLVFFCIIVLGFSFAHPFYLSVTDLKYNTKEKAIQASVKVFVNDLEAALKKISKKPVDLINPKDTAQTNKLLAAYLATHFNLKLNGEPKTFDFIGFELEQEAIWLFVEFKKCNLPKKVEIENAVLYDFIKDQTNIVNMEVNGKLKNTKVSYPEKKLLFEF